MSNEVSVAFRQMRFQNSIPFSVRGAPPIYPYRPRRLRLSKAFQSGRNSIKTRDVRFEVMRSLQQSRRAVVYRSPDMQFENSTSVALSWTGEMINLLRVLAGFSLFGSIFFGIVLGWFDSLPFDPRWIGLVLGLVVGLTVFIWRRGTWIELTTTQAPVVG